MTNEKITEGNKLIASFMKMTYDPSKERKWEESTGWRHKSLHFHEDWNWLLSCIEKISNQCEEPEELDTLKYALLCNDINTAWNFVIDYLKGNQNDK